VRKRGKLMIFTKKRLVIFQINKKSKFKNKNLSKESWERVSIKIQKELVV